MYNTMAACSWWTWLLHFTMVILGGFLLVNLTIAVIYINFNKNFAESKKQAKGSKATCDCRAGGLSVRHRCFICHALRSR